MGSIGFEEMLVIIVVAILVYGRNLPQAARKAGQFYTKVKRQITDMKDEIQRQIPTTDDIVPSDDKPLPEGKSDPDPPGHVAPGSTPSANLPGPDPSDPEYRAPFDPSKPRSNGNGHAGDKKEPAPPATPAP